MSLVERVRGIFHRSRTPEQNALPEGMVPAGKLARRAARSQAPPPAPNAVDPELVARRDRLIERFVVMQAELGGLYYEMAIRDHVRPEVLAGKAAELQRVDLELAQVERTMLGPDVKPAGECPSCAAPYRDGDLFCSRCAHPLHSGPNGRAS